MAALPNCPLDANAFLQRWWENQSSMGLSHLIEIENHVSTDSCHHPALKEFIFDGHAKGTTPLLLACHYGKFDSVKRIVESWGVDVRTAATYYQHPFFVPNEALMKIESATPLFVAAFQGHSKIVQYLLEKGADATAKTSNEAEPKYDGLTPLNGAVSERWWSPNYGKDTNTEHWGRMWDPLLEEPLQHVERNAIVHSLLAFGADISAFKPPNGEPIWMSRLCCVDATMTLINHGMDLEQRDPYEAGTVLHHWVSSPYRFTERDALTIVKRLVEKGADVMARDKFGFTPIIKAANNIDHRLHLAHFDFLLERDAIPIMEKIEALELVGAKILTLDGNARRRRRRFKAFDYWRRATHLRQTEGSGLYHKKVAQRSVGTVEWTTSDELEHLFKHSTRYKIHIQSILVQLRILSIRSSKAVREFFMEYREDLYKSEHCFRFAKLDYLWQQKRYFELLDIYWSMLDTVLLFQPSDEAYWGTSFIKSIIWTLWNLKKSYPKLLNLAIVKKSIHLTLATDLLSLDDDELEGYYFDTDSFSIAMFSFLRMLLDLPEMLHDIMESLPPLFGHLPHGQLEWLLLQSCRDYNNAHYTAIIRLLLQLGADVNTTDKDGNRPLHLVAQSESEHSEATGCLLIGYGAQLHSTNNSGKTAVDLWIECNEMEDDQEGEEGAAESRRRPDWCRTVPKLLCLSARCIRAHGVPYEDEPEFFQDSHSFIKNH